MKTISFECDDSYEAEKLASLVSVQKDETVWVAGVANVIGNEIVIMLKDRSSHAVLLKSEQVAKKLAIFLADVTAGKVIVKSSDSSGPTANVVVLD